GALEHRTFDGGSALPAGFAVERRPGFGGERCATGRRAHARQPPIEPSNDYAVTVGPSMARFEQRVTDEQVASARRKIAAGASLRSAAAEVPCAASTLSDRIKKAEAAEADALVRAGIDKRGGHPAKRRAKTAED